MRRRPSSARRTAGLLGLGAAAIAVVVVGRGLRQEGPAAPGSPAAAAAFVVEGSVRSLDGQPLPGARVELFALDEAHAFRALGGGASAGDATFRLAFAPPGRDEPLILVRASAPGHASESRTFELGTRRVDLRLAADPASVTVHVETAPDQPSAGARVLLTFEPVAAPRDALYAWRAIADERGVARFDGLPQLPGTLHVLAEDEGGRAFRETAKPAGALTTEVRIGLERGRAVRLRLAPSEPGDLTTADVVLREVEGPWHARVRPDAAGHIELTGVPAGVALLAEVAGDWALREAAPAMPWQLERAATPAAAIAATDGPAAAIAATDGPAAARPEVLVPVTPAGVIEGVVLDERGAPLPAATVTATPQGEQGGVPRRIQTDLDGRFAASGLSLATSWTIEARHPGHAPARLPEVAARARDLRLQLRQGGTLIGRVVDRAGRGIAGVEVYAHAMERRGDTAEGLPEHAALRTDEDGRYRLGHLNPGLYRFEVRPTARMQWANTAAIVQEHTVRAGDNPLPAVTLTRGAALIGRVPAAPSAAGAGARPAGERDVTLEVALLPAGQQGVPHRVAVQPDDHGRFEVEELEPGTFRVQVRSRGRGWSEPTEVTLRESDATEASFRFANAARLEGKIAFADGRVPRNARIDLYRERGPERAAHDLSGNWAAVADDGRYVVTGLAAGRYTARISSDESAPRILPVELAGERTARSFAVERGVTLEVALRSTAAVPAGKLVLLEPSDGAGAPMQAVADADGVARFERVAAGAYQARAVMPGMPRRALRAEERRVELTVD